MIEAIHDQTTLTPFFGLWKEGISEGLLWQIVHSPTKRPSLYRAPSFSWFSVDDPITQMYFLNDTEIKYVASNIQTSLHYSGHDPQAVHTHKASNSIKGLTANVLISCKMRREEDELEKWECIGEQELRGFSAKSFHPYLDCLENETMMWVTFLVLATKRVHEESKGTAGEQDNVASLILRRLHGSAVYAPDIFERIGCFPIRWLVDLDNSNYCRDYLDEL